jgi:hypothetical protein
MRCLVTSFAAPNPASHSSLPAPNPDRISIARHGGVYSSRISVHVNFFAVPIDLAEKQC